MRSVIAGIEITDTEKERLAGLHDKTVEDVDTLIEAMVSTNKLIYNEETKRYRHTVMNNQREKLIKNQLKTALVSVTPNAIYLKEGKRIIKSKLIQIRAISEISTYDLPGDNKHHSGCNYLLRIFRFNGWYTAYYDDESKRDLDYQELIKKMNI